ncbi:MAG: ArnT family glycosyltransferase, partial [Anaerolineae bacterium]
APWGQNRFLEDEALYGYWGLQIATGADPMLDQEPVDKPPLYPYTLALSFLALGPNETAARLPSLLASVAGIALVYALGRALYADAVLGLLAALLLALSPFDLLFASTAFTDPLMTAWVLGALLAAARGRPGTAGLLAGLAAATKQQGLFFLPLVVAVLALALTRLPKFRLRDRNRSVYTGPPKSPALALSQETLEVFDREQGRLPRRRLGPWPRFGFAFAAVAAVVIAWGLARVQRPGFFAQSLISYGGLGPAQPQALGPRAVAWLELLSGFWGGALAALLAVALLALLGAAWVRGRAGHSPGQTARRRIDGLLAGFLAVFLLLHWLVGFQVWDRYLLGLVPLAALLAARLLLGAVRLVPVGRWRPAAATALALLLLATLARPVALAAGSELPLGGDHGAYDGIDQLAAFLRAEAPPGAVVYHYWLGYHYHFYLHGAPLRLHWYPDPADLVHDATVYRREPRYIAFPSFRDGGQAQAALAAAGIELLPVYETHRRDGSVSFRLYRLEGPG